MALVQAVNTIQVQQKIDDFARNFRELEAAAQDLVAFRAELLDNANVPLVLGIDGQAMTATVKTELAARLNALNSFVTYANTGNPSPLAYLRSIKRNV